MKFRRVLLLSEASQQELPQPVVNPVGACPHHWNSVMGDSSNASLTPAIELTGRVVAVHQNEDSDLPRGAITTTLPGLLVVGWFWGLLWK